MADHTKLSEKPFRAGIFSTVEQTEHVIEELLAAGFTKDQIAVICSDEAKQRHFGDLEPTHPSPNDAANSGFAGSAIGALLGGAVGAIASTGVGIPVLIIAPGMLGGAVFGGLVGIFSTRGEETENIDFFHQSVAEGQLLVTVECHGDDAAHQLHLAEAAFRKAGVEPLALVEG